MIIKKLLVVLFLVSAFSISFGEPFDWEDQTNNTLNPLQQVVSAKFANGKIEIIIREKNIFINGVPDRVWKEIYGVKRGEIVLEKTIQGMLCPAHMVEERIEFPE